MAVRRLRMISSVFIVAGWVVTGEVWTDAAYVDFAGTEAGAGIVSGFVLERDLVVIVAEDETFCS